MSFKNFSTFLSKTILIALLFAWQSAVALINTPTQSAPKDNDTGIVTSPYFYITGISSQADEVIVEYAENNTMSSPSQLSINRGSTGAFLYGSKLKLNTDYYWRVRLKNSTDSSNWSSIRKFTTTTIFRTFYPGNNVSEWQGSFINFRAHRVFDYDTILWEIDTTSSFNSSYLRSIEVPDTGSTTEVSTLQENFKYNQKYYWRAKAYTGSNVSAWTPTLYFITGDTIGLKYPTRDWKQSVEIEVEWTKWRNDEPTQIQLDTTPNFSSPLLDTFLSRGIRPLSEPRYRFTELNYETQYYYRARSYNATDTTPWSNSHFETKGLGKDIVLADNYADPKVEIRNSTAIDGSTGYQIILDTSANFDSELLQSFYSVNGRDTAENLIFGAIYYAKARPYHSKDSGDWTRTRPINIISYPITYYPYRNWTDIGISDSIQFGTRWGIDGYQIQITAGSRYDTTLLLDTTITGLVKLTTSNYIHGPRFRYNTTYEWRIRGWHTTDTSSWSDSKKFTTVISPTLTRPFNSDFLGDQAELDLQWESMGSGVSYQVMLDTTPAFSSPILVDSLLDTNALAQKDLLFRPLYYWKVRAIALDDTSAWSDTWKFTVLRARLNLPRNNRTNITTDISSLDWNSIQGTNGYILQLDSFADFRNPEEFSDTVKNSFFHYFFDKPEIITFNTKYYWRVKLYHAKDTSEWSDVWNFTTLPRRAPVQVSPIDSAEDVKVIPTFTWEAYSGASSYAVEYSEDSSFTSATKVTSTTTSLKVTLKPSTRYYWRVRGRNSDGNEFYDWSEEWTFVTDIGIPAVTLISPLNTAEDQPRDVTLRWNKNNDATSYRVELSQNIDFSGVFRNTATVAATNYTGLANGETYYWRVRTLSNSLTSPWSETWSFTVVEKTNSLAKLDDTVILLFPNPSADYVSVEGVADNISITVLNSLGQQVIIPINNRILDIRTLASGVYYVRITENGKTATKTLLVNSTN